VIASFNIAKMIAQSGQPFIEGEFIKSCMIRVAEDIEPSFVQKFKDLSLSATTITDRVSEIGKELKFRLRSKTSEFVFFFQ